MTKLHTPLLKKTAFASTLEFDALVAGVRGTQTCKNGKVYQIEIVRIFTAEPDVKGLDETRTIDGYTNGIYSDGKNWWQIAFKRVGVS